MIRKYQKVFNYLLIFVDILVVLVSFLLAYYIRFITLDGVANFNYVPMLGWLVPIVLGSNLLAGMYKPIRTKTWAKLMLIILKANCLNAGLIFSVLFLNKSYMLSRGFFIEFVVFVAALSIVNRYFLRVFLTYIRRKGKNKKYVLVLGMDELAQKLTDSLENNSQLGYEVLGYLDDNLKRGLKILGRIDDLKNILADKKNTIDEVISTISVEGYSDFYKVVETCEYFGIRLKVVPSYFPYLQTTPEVEDISGIPLLKLRSVPLDDPINNVVKRFSDVLLSVIAIVLTAPILIILAIGIKLTSPGPILFRQERIGLNNRPFDMYKFRSMKVSNDNSAATQWTTANDPRKTWFGTFMRKTSLDELPQFFNVLFGDMSIVGPRPERPFFVDKFKDEVPKYMVKHQVRPGITGWAQVNGWRGDTSIEKRIECDIYYVERWTLGFDLKIMFLTVWKGLINKNAY